MFLFILARSSSWLRQHLASATSVHFWGQPMTSRIEPKERQRRDRRAEIAVDFFDLPLCIYDSQLAQCPPVKLSASLSVYQSLCQSVSQRDRDRCGHQKKRKKKNCDLLSSEECDHVGLATLGLAWPKARNFDCKLICSNCQQQQRAEIAAGAAAAAYCL